jgi:hypothetical protein
MTVADLIKELETVKDKSLDVYLFDQITGNLTKIDAVDLSLADKVDLSYEEAYELISKTSDLR